MAVVSKKEKYNYKNEHTYMKDMDVTFKNG
jgi:hypothetical protein